MYRSGRLQSTDGWLAALTTTQGTGPPPPGVASSTTWPGPSGQCPASSTTSSTGPLGEARQGGLQLAQGRQLGLAEVAGSQVRLDRLLFRRRHLAVGVGREQLRNMVLHGLTPIHMTKLGAQQFPQATPGAAEARLQR